MAMKTSRCSNRTNRNAVQLKEQRQGKCKGKGKGKTIKRSTRRVRVGQRGKW